MKTSLTLTLLSFLFLISCATPRERADKFLKNNPKYLAEQCAINFPPTTKYITGKAKVDTVYTVVPGQEIPCPEYEDKQGNLTKPTAKCPDQLLPSTHTQQTDTVYLENTANLLRLKQLNLELAGKVESLTEDNTSLKDKVQEQKRDIIAQFVIIGLLAFMLIRKQISK